MNHRGPFQPVTFCDSVNSETEAGKYIYYRGETDIFLVLFSDLPGANNKTYFISHCTGSILHVCWTAL